MTESQRASQDNIRQNISRGAGAAWPVFLGYIPLGLAFGVIARNAGLQPWQIGIMSVALFAGSAQFIAASMLSAGAGFASIIITTLAVNLRHFLMSSSLSVYLGNVSKRLLSLFAYGVTDETFAVNLIKFRGGSWSFSSALTVNHVSNFSWVASTIAGGYVGEFIPEGAFGIDYALVAMFIGLLSMQLRGRKYVLTALCSGVLAVVFSLLLPGNFYIMAASMAAATGGVLILRKIRQVAQNERA
ncbi:MAG: AzlC family ABC transporter permease [Dehalococcoidales bacterium]|jgi:4-azaleucine resistance transporter AzlC|nr:AzlC family ABC transporter permease [Dehalococcoidales bacterium]MDD3265411.1 AzlC family ABC transporter permease [Dehalococcoidales bacterium]MDD4322989.1 AzlC family ABC transporter permease [Dehalococcoidales bacterium]MDD4794669.1 AzlC family ABC transporter permease [Dehalococcoidales bacterium]MDD5122140.1 AzlC family ABC transporter permease [Dehalococcoidales bacterium]